MIKPIKGFERYLISSEDGQIYSNAKGKSMYPLKTFEKPDGYLAVSLWDDSVRGKKKRKTLLVHRLVGLTFIDNPKNKPTINHKDGNKKNNCVDNLEWATLSEQEKHSFKLGLNYARKGEDSNRAEITWDDVHFIRNNYPDISVSELSNRIGISDSDVYAILYNYIWVDTNYKSTAKKQLSKEDVIYIRQHPELKGKDLAKMFNTSQSTVSEIRNNKIWKGVY